MKTFTISILLSLLPYQLTLALSPSDRTACSPPKELALKRANSKCNSWFTYHSCSSAIALTAQIEQEFPDLTLPDMIEKVMARAFSDPLMGKSTLREGVILYLSEAGVLEVSSLPAAA